MSRLEAQQPEASFPPINKGLPKVERPLRRHSSSRQVKSSISRSSSQKLSNKVFLVFFLLKIEESSSDSTIHQLSSKSVRFEKKLPNPQVNSPEISEARALSQKEVQNKLAAPKESSFTKQDDESSSIDSDNKVYYENPMYESSIAEDSTPSSISLVMMTGTLSIEEQLANLTRLVEGLAKQYPREEYSIAQLMNHLEVARQVKLHSRSRKLKKNVKAGVDGSIISMKECQAHFEITPTNEELSIESTSQDEKLSLENLAKQQDLIMLLTKVEPVTALDTPLKGFVRPIEDVKLEGSKTVKILDTSSKDFDKLPTSRTSTRFDPNAFRLLTEAGYNSKSQNLCGKLPKEAFGENGNSTGLGYKCASPIHLKIKRATT
ncbi:hypothetical protein M9H77_01934 [Catharanthus roseus]|uniref:Uncharacterized protein n=1 Tax=Catharanthus roseus TaxID=4058 RepID=A0ACC0C6Z4_CATRO|nr:hypothetical protein M9H77_01934 [Catharanthus roseus]